jgi:hypothetical protein
VFHLRTLLASTATALALAVIGPLFVGAAPALAAGPHMAPSMSHPRMGNGAFMHGNGVFQNFSNFRRFDPDHDHDVDFPRHVVRPFPLIRSFPVVQQVPVFQPVVQPVIIPVVTQPSFFWMSYGPGWNVGMPYSQMQQVCGQYNQAMGYSSAAYNQFVSAVCINISVNGNQVAIQVYP